METKNLIPTHRIRPRHPPQRANIPRHTHPVADVLEQVESGMAYEAIIEVALRDRQATRLPKQSAIACEAPAAYATGLVQ